MGSKKPGIDLEDLFTKVRSAFRSVSFKYLPRSKNQFVDTLYAHCKTQHQNSMSYKAKMNGTGEATNKPIKKIL